MPVQEQLLQTKMNLQKEYLPCTELCLCDTECSNDEDSNIGDGDCDDNDVQWLISVKLTEQLKLHTVKPV